MQRKLAVQSGAIVARAIFFCLFQMAPLIPSYAAKPDPLSGEIRSCPVPIDSGTGLDSLLICGTLAGSQLQLAIVPDSGVCPFSEENVTDRTIFYKSISATELATIAQTLVPETSPNRVLTTASQPPPLVETLLSAISHQFKDSISSTNTEICSGAEPAPGTCDTPEQDIQCCIAQSNGDNHSNGGNGGGAPPGGQQGGSQGGGGGSGGQPPVQSFETLLVRESTGGATLLHLKIPSNRGQATAENPFGVCVIEGSESPEASSYNQGALQQSGCNPGYKWVHYKDFMRDMTVSGIAIAAPAFVLSPPIAVGVVAVVGGYLLYRWLTAPTAQELVYQAIVNCETICISVNSTLRMVLDAATVTSTTLVIWDEATIVEALQRRFRNHAQRIPRLDPRPRGEECCQKVCVPPYHIVPDEVRALGCKDACIRACLGGLMSCALAPLVPGFLDDPIGLACLTAGYFFGQSICP